MVQSGLHQCQTATSNGSTFSSAMIMRICTKSFSRLPQKSVWALLHKEAEASLLVRNSQLHRPCQAVPLLN